MKKNPYYIALYQDEKIIINAKVSLLKGDILEDFYWCEYLMNLLKDGKLNKIHGFIEKIYININRLNSSVIDLRHKSLKLEESFNEKIKIKNVKREGKPHKEFEVNLCGLKLVCKTFDRVVNIFPSSEFYGQINFKKVIGGLVSKKHLRYLSSLTEILY